MDNLIEKLQMEFEADKALEQVNNCYDIEQMRKMCYKLIDLARSYDKLGKTLGELIKTSDEREEALKEIALSTMKMLKEAIRFVPDDKIQGLSREQYNESFDEFIGKLSL